MGEVPQKGVLTGSLCHYFNFQDFSEFLFVRHYLEDVAGKIPVCWVLYVEKKILFMKGEYN